MWIAWMIAAGVFLIAELVTTALVSIWFVPSAIVAAIISVWIDSVWIQILIFLILSAAFFIIFKNVYKKHIQPKDVGSIENMLVGKKAVAVEEIGASHGKVTVGDVYWKAVSASGETIPANDTVIITDVKGTTLKVEALKSN